MGTIRPPSLFLLAGMAALGPLALNFYVPALPAVAAQFAVTPSAAQWTLTLYFIGISFGQIIHGPLSDAIGRRPVVLGGLALYALASFACYFAATLDLLLVARFIQALGGCVGMVMSRAVLQDVFQRERFAAALSTVVMVSAVAPMFAPAVGGFITEWLGWRIVFLLLGGGALVLFGACLQALPETHLNRNPLTLISLVSAYPVAMRHRGFMLNAVAAALFPATNFTIMAAGPFLVVDVLKATPSTYGAMAMTAPLGFILGNAVARRLLLRVDHRRLMLVAAGVSLAGLSLQLALVALVPLTLAGLFLPLLVVAFGHGLGLACATGLAMAQLPDLRGTASASIGFLQMGIGALASTAGSMVVPHGAVATVLAMLAIQGFDFVLLILGRHLDHGARGEIHSKDNE
ncbi:multidrug effflux MFS transporter [Xanthobacter agilis]|uniref:multidrug effflux MFS transporter n=1 Tax=Xanthobacter agilis TaxID=47492 RepID=UPI00372C265A